MAVVAFSFGVVAAVAAAVAPGVVAELVVAVSGVVAGFVVAVFAAAGPVGGRLPFGGVILPAEFGGAVVAQPCVALKGSFFDLPGGVLPLVEPGAVFLFRLDNVSVFRLQAGRLLP